LSRLPYGGKMIVTGLGKVDEDEFMLTLLNEQVDCYINTPAPII